MPALGSIWGLRPLGQPRFRRLAVIVLAMVVVAFRGVQFLVFVRQIQWGYDFSAYLSAADHLLHGLPIYQPEQLAGTYSPQQQYLYLYPPFLAAAVTPIAAFFSTDYRLAAWVWAAIGGFVLVLVTIGVARLERLAPTRHPATWLVAAIAFPPVIGELVMGNVHLILLGLLALAWFGIRRGGSSGELLAGAAVGAATMIKVFPGLLVVWFLVTGRYRAAGAVLGAMILLGLVSIPLTGIGPWLDYPTVIANLGPPVDPYSTLSPSVWLGAILGVTVARLLVPAVMLALAVWAARRLDDGAGFALTVVASVLIAPALYHHYLAILVLPLMIGVAHVRRPALLLLPYLALFAGDQPALGANAWILNRVVPTAGMFALVVILVGFGLRRHRAGTRHVVGNLGPAAARGT